jgi:hypothetical protein
MRAIGFSSIQALAALTILLGTNVGWPCSSWLAMIA